MKSYVNGFVYGRDLLKKVIMATVICCVLSIVFRQNMLLQGVFAAAIFLGSASAFLGAACFFGFSAVFLVFALTDMRAMMLPDLFVMLP